jgi:phosphopantothenoylcysteine decarboxylase/phosphopantothenate--cysteine ligase
VANPDILKTLAGQKTHQLCVGFAAETQDVVQHATAKLKAKSLDLVVANDVSGGKGFGAADNEVTLIDSSGVVAELGPAPKRVIADGIWDHLADRITVRLKNRRAP